jgi:hypothetical protein
MAPMRVAQRVAPGLDPQQIGDAADPDPPQPRPGEAAGQRRSRIERVGSERGAQSLSDGGSWLGDGGMGGTS